MQSIEIEVEIDCESGNFQSKITDMLENGGDCNCHRNLEILKRFLTEDSEFGEIEITDSGIDPCF